MTDDSTPLTREKRLTPRQKKLLSYQKDGRNTYAEARAIAHKAIAQRKSLRTKMNTSDKGAGLLGMAKKRARYRRYYCKGPLGDMDVPTK